MAAKVTYYEPPTIVEMLDGKIKMHKIGIELCEGLKKSIGSVKLTPELERLLRDGLRKRDYDEE